VPFLESVEIVIDLYTDRYENEDLNKIQTRYRGFSKNFSKLSSKICTQKIVSF